MYYIRKIFNFVGFLLDFNFCFYVKLHIHDKEFLLIKCCIGFYNADSFSNGVKGAIGSDKFGRIEYFG